MKAPAIFEQEIEKDDKGVVKTVAGWVGPEDGVTTPQRNDKGDRTGVSIVEYQKYATYQVRIREGRLSYWRIEIIDQGAISVYEGKSGAPRPSMELEGNGAIGILRVAQIINAVMSLAVSYCDERLENQKSTA